MIVAFTPTSWEDFMDLHEKEKKLSLKVNRLIKEISRNPYEGTGLPEPLKHDYSGYWSRRIDRKNRLVYKMLGAENEEQTCVIISCRFHYGE